MVHHLRMMTLEQSADLISAARHLVIVNEVHEADERGRIERARRSGDLVTLSRGVHLAATRWAGLSNDDRYRLRSIAAHRLLTPGEVLSHRSAAVLRHLPLVGDWPRRAESSVLCGTGLTSSTALRRHRVVRPPRRELLGGIPVTTLPQTVVDLAAELPFICGVTVSDAALRMLESSRDPHQLAAFHAGVWEIASALGTGRGSARVRRVLSFSDGRSESPGESVTRAALHILGTPTPVPQHTIVGISGRVWRVDLAWPELGIVLEFDGKSKYTDPRFMAGRSAAEVLYEEKLREDDIRPRVRSFGRVDWPTVMNLPRLAARVAGLGVPLPARRASVLA